MIFNPCCCCDIVLIAISNSNSAVDDDFNIKLNGLSIGTIDNNHSTCTGRFFLMKVGNPLWPEAGDPFPICGNITSVVNTFFCDSGVCDFQPYIPFPISFLTQGTNVLQIWVTAINNNGNFGKVRVLGLQQKDNNFEVCKTYLDTTYSFGTPSPGDLPKMAQAFNFTWSL